MATREDIHEIVFLKLTQGLNEEQEMLLQSWLAECTSNRNYYQEICSLWYAGKWAAGREHVQKSKGWNRVVVVKQQIRRKRLIKVWSASVAASCLLIFGMLFWLRSVENREEISLSAISRQSNVMLILASGKQMDVNDIVSRQIQEEGITILADSALLAYKENKESPASKEIVYNELIIPKCGEYRLHLADGSVVVLNSESRLRYPVNFNGDSREVFLSGEACFEVAKNPEKPFIVHTEHASVRVLGTLFNVSAYPNDGTTEITLVNGAVQVTREVKDTLLPGQQFLLNNITLESHIRNVDTDIYVAWTNGLFRFDAMPLEQLMLKLSRWIPITYKFKDESLKKIRFTGGFKKYDDVDHMLKMLGEIINISFKREGQEIIIDWYQN